MENQEIKFVILLSRDGWFDSIYYDPYKFLNLYSQISRVRTIHEQFGKLLSAGERHFVDAKTAFQPFSGMQAVNYNPFNQPLWDAAVNQFNKIIEPVEERIANKLREKFQNTNVKSFQVRNVQILVLRFTRPGHY